MSALEVLAVGSLVLSLAASALVAFFGLEVGLLGRPDPWRSRGYWGGIAGALGATAAAVAGFLIVMVVLGDAVAVELVLWAYGLAAGELLFGGLFALALALVPRRPTRFAERAVVPAPGVARWRHRAPVMCSGLAGVFLTTGAALAGGLPT